MDETNAVKAISETLNQPRIGGVELRLRARTLTPNVTVSADYESDRSLTLTAYLGGRISDADRETLEGSGWQPWVGPNGIPQATLRHTWRNATPDTAVVVAAEARRALEIAAPQMRTSEPLVVRGGGLDQGFGQVGCFLAVPSIAIALGVVAILRLQADLPLSGGYFLLLAVIGEVVALVTPPTLVSLAARVRGLRPHLEAIALGSVAVLGAPAILLANQILAPA
jgi:hypothetical protein